MPELSNHREILLKDGVEYIEHSYSAESELEDIVLEHSEAIFGRETILFRKQRLRSAGGVGSIPDAFVIDLTERRWYVIEVELDSHPLFEHIVNQIARFRAGISDSGTLVSLKKAFYEQIKDDPEKELLFQKRAITEIYKFVSDILDGPPVVEIVIDRLSTGQEDIIEALPFRAHILELRTYYRKGVVAEDHVHRFIPLEPRSAPAASTEEAQQTEEDTAPPSAREMTLGADHTGKKIVAFRFQGQRREVTMWKELLLGVCEMLYQQRRADYGVIFQIEGRSRTYFSKDPEGMREPREIGQSGIYAETHASANTLANITGQVLEAFGCSTNDVRVEQVSR
jgi:hypothetical protein